MKHLWSQRAKRFKKKTMEWVTAQGRVVWIPGKRGRGRIVVTDTP
jgi:hypothetical protein